MSARNRTVARTTVLALVGIAALAAPLWLLAGAITSLNSFTDGSVASAGAMNANFSAVQTAVNDNASDVALLQQAASIRDMYTRWGQASCAAGDTLVYSGLAFGGIRGHYGGTKPLCMKSGDPGAAYNGSNHGTYLVPLATYYTGNDASHQVPGVTARRVIPCAVCTTPKRCLMLPGSHTCPAGWSSITPATAWLAAGYYSNGPPLEPFCYEVNNSAATASSDQDQVFSASTGAPGYMSSGYTGFRHTKCAVCCK